jgi:tetratricopeptide (TPR) repeat protein
MKKNTLVILILFIILNFITDYTYANNPYFEEAKILFDQKQYKEAKFYFEKDIVFNPKNENSYLYLAKVFKEEKKDNLVENNLNTVLLLNPRNEEAIYLLALLSIKKSNYSKVKELISTLTSVCKKMCSSKLELQKMLDTSLESQ